MRPAARCIQVRSASASSFTRAVAPALARGALLVLLALFFSRAPSRAHADEAADDPKEAAPAESNEPKETKDAKESEKGLTLGAKAPEFTLPDLDGKKVTLSDRLERGPVLIDFWALWCKPCLQSLPGTDKFLEKYGKRGLSVLAVNTDSPRTVAKVKAYVKSNGFGFDVLSDPNGTMQRLYRFYRIPQTFLIASDGTIAFSQLGYSPGSEERLAKEIEKLLPPGQESKGE